MSLRPFGDLFQSMRNGMNVRQDGSGVGLPITRIETISTGRVDGAKVGYAGLREADVRQWLLRPGDILFSHINSPERVGNCAVYEGEPDKLVHGMNLLCLRCDPQGASPDYVKHLMRSSGFRAQLSRYVNRAVNQASVSIGNLASLPVTVPLVSEQRRIAAILDQADALRAKRRAAIAQLDTLAQSIFLEMFGDPATAGERWERIPLGDLVTAIDSGWSPVCLDRPASCTEWGVLKLGAVTYCSYDPSENKALPSDLPPRPELEVSAGDLLFTRKNTYDLVGACAFVRETPPRLLLSDSFYRT